MIEDTWARKVGQIWTTVWLMLQQNESIGMYSKFRDSWARNMFSRTNMGFCMANITSEEVNEFL
jgi:hypothetical protein